MADGYRNDKSKRKEEDMVKTLFLVVAWIIHPNYYDPCERWVLFDSGWE